ncbi:72 kDa type IV collagenase-like [Dendronephthya gigantea]|uniref:72 kDa type IV collagenase-like n=1 Tax=Dendronephthya gigantea TaxID=151771 RepID=UPI00106C6183|nr:72 kDa type IV collagenase-like [Dendronephthya gigantea]
MIYHSGIIFLATLVSLLLLDSVQSFTINPLGVSGREESQVVTFMDQYGYLEPKDPRLGQFRTREELVRGIKQMQEFAGIKVTGKIDEETVRLIKSPRCSLPDFGPSDKMKRRKRYALHHAKWKNPSLTYKVLNTSTTELRKSEVRNALDRAFKMWSEVSPLRFTEVFGNEKADLMVSFERGNHDDGYPFDGRGDKIAHAFYPDIEASAEAGDIHFDDEEHWTLDKPKAGTDFMWTAVHEIGHAIGLDHTTYAKAIMYPYYTGYRPNLALHDDDVMAIQAQYGKKPVSTAAPTIDPKLHWKNGPSPCDTSIDAVVHSSDGNTYFFKNPYFWTLDKYDNLLAGRKIRDHWAKLHPRVQAAYTRRDGKTVFFKGRKYWVFEGTTLVEGPKYITEYGLPIELKRLDGAFTWGGNGKTYFFKGSKYWRYNEQMNRIDPGYPKNISDGWGAVQYPIDSVMTWKDGETYFFKGANVAKHNWHLYKPEEISKVFFKPCHQNFAEKNLPTEQENGVVKTSNFAPLIAFLAIIASLCSW